MAKVLNVGKIIQGNYPVALETDDGNTATMIPHSLVSDMRAEYEKRHLQATRLTDVQLVSIAALFTDDIKATDTILIEEVDKADPPQQVEAKSTKSVSATGRDTMQLHVSRLLASNVEACTAIQRWMDIGVEKKTLPATIPYLLQKTFPKDVRAGMPIPGSVKPDKYKGNLLFDRADDKPGTESWYVGAVEDFPGYWENIGGPLRKLGEVLAKDSTVQNEYTSRGVQKNRDHKKLLEQRKRDLVSGFRDGIELLNLIDLFMEKIEGCHIFFRVIDGQVETTTQPMRVVFIDTSKGELEEGRSREKYLSCGALRRIELEQVLAAKDRFEAFKPTRPPAEPEDQAITTIQSAGDLEKVIGWLAINRRNGELKTAILRRLNAPPSESDTLLDLAFAAKDFLDEVLDSAKLRQRNKMRMENTPIVQAA